MRIAFFTESLLPWVDGVSLTLAHLFESLEAGGCDFRVYAPFRPPSSVSWSDRVHLVPSVTFPLYRDYRVSVPLARIARELDDYRPDLIHVVSPTPMAVWGQAYARRRQLPVVASFHTHFVSYFRYYGLRGLEPVGWRMLRWFHHRCHVTFAPSCSIVEELRAHGIANVHLWSRGVDARRFAPDWRDQRLRDLVGASAARPLLLLVSRLVKEKDLLDLIGVHRELTRRGVGYRLVLVGNGPLRRRLERALPDAYFAGYQTGEALSRWYASADVFVFPSTTETFGNVVQEAQASAVPSVVVDRGGPQGVIEPGVTGFVARANDPIAIAAQLEPLLRDRELRQTMGRAARERALQSRWDIINAGLLDEYRRLSGRPTARRMLA